MLKTKHFLLFLGISALLAGCSTFLLKNDPNQTAEILENSSENLILKAVQNQKSLETALDKLSKENKITYISSELNIPLDLYDQFMNENPQIVYTTLEDYEGINYSSQTDTSFSFEVQGEIVNTYQTTYPLNQIPFVEGQYYVLVHSSLEKQILQIR